MIPLLLVACGAPSEPSTDAPGAEPAVEEGPATDAPPWAPAALQLPPSLRSRLEVIRRDVGLAARSDAETCAVVAELLEVRAPLAAHLEARASAVAEAAPDGEAEAGGEAEAHGEAEAEAWDQALRALGEGVPGLVVAPGAETVHVAVDWPELARAVGEGPTANALVSLGAFLGRQPAWARPVTDITACADHAAVAPWLDRLRPSLERAPACLAETTAPALREALARLADHTCFCADRATATQQATENANRLARYEDLDGPELADRLRRAVSSETARFDGDCGG